MVISLSILMVHTCIILPAEKVTIYSDDDTYVEKYSYDNTIDYSPNEIIHIKENSFNSIYRGVPRLKPAYRTMQLLKHEKLSR